MLIKTKEFGVIETELYRLVRSFANRHYAVSSTPAASSVAATYQHRSHVK